MLVACGFVLGFSFDGCIDRVVIGLCGGFLLASAPKEP
jgi:hypothetical protein